MPKTVQLKQGLTLGLQMHVTSRAKYVEMVLIICQIYFVWCYCSGLIVPEHYGNETVPEVVSQSGYALLHFFSDAAYNLTGFNISYR